jgi:hypothetical protein
VTRYAIRRRPVVAIRPRMEWDEDYPLLPHIEVDGPAEVDTGLITESGDTIMRLPDPLGFHHPEGDL